MPVAKLPLSKQLAYACGMIGWSIMTKYYYCDATLLLFAAVKCRVNTLVPQLLVFGVFNIMSLIAASGRFIDAIFDPCIALRERQEQHVKGRRIPFMKWPFCLRLFFARLPFIRRLRAKVLITPYGYFYPDLFFYGRNSIYHSL